MALNSRSSVEGSRIIFQERPADIARGFAIGLILTAACSAPKSADAWEPGPTPTPTPKVVEPPTPTKTPTFTVTPPRPVPEATPTPKNIPDGAFLPNTGGVVPEPQPTIKAETGSVIKETGWSAYGEAAKLGLYTITEDESAPGAQLAVMLGQPMGSRIENIDGKPHMIVKLNFDNEGGKLEKEFTIGWVGASIHCQKLNSGTHIPRTEPENAGGSNQGACAPTRVIVGDEVSLQLFSQGQKPVVIELWLTQPNVIPNSDQCTTISCQSNVDNLKRIEANSKHVQAYKDGHPEQSNPDEIAWIRAIVIR